jgi:transposase InsO family protein
MNAIYTLCGISRQAHQQAIQRSLNESEKAYLYVRQMEDVRQEHPGMGLRTMYELLQPEGIGRDAFVALGLQEGFRLRCVEKYTRTTYSVKSSRYGNLLGDLTFNDINRVWSSDITYYYFEGRFYYIVLLMDVYSRRIIGYSIADNMRAENNLYSLEMGLKTRGIAHYTNTLIHHSDKGTQYASDNYTDLLERKGIRISMCREVYENTHIERLNGTIKNQYLNRWNIHNLKELKSKLNETIYSYNHTRPHFSLNKLSPIQFEENLKKVPLKDRFNMKIFTTDTNSEISKTKQLSLFND